MKTQHLLTLAAASVLICGESRAAAVIQFSESGGNVVAVTTGTLNFLGAVQHGSTNAYIDGYVNSATNYVAVGPSVVRNTILWEVSQMSPSSMGTLDAYNAASSNAGNTAFFINGGIYTYPSTTYNLLYIDSSYVNGSSISNTNTWNDQSFSSLGLTPGSYVFNWGSGATADSLTINVGPVSPTPEPSAALLGSLSLLGLLRRRRG